MPRAVLGWRIARASRADSSGDRGDGGSWEKKKERRTRVTPEDPRQGAYERHLADAPLRGRGTSTASYAKDTRVGCPAQVGGFLRAVLVAHATIGLSTRPSKAAVQARCTPVG